MSAKYREPQRGGSVETLSIACIGNPGDCAAGPWERLGKLAIDIVVDSKVPSPRTKKPERPRTRCSGLVGLTGKNQAISETKGISIPWPKVPILEQRCVKFSGRVAFWSGGPIPGQCCSRPAGQSGKSLEVLPRFGALGETELALCGLHSPMSCKVFRRTAEQSDAAAQCELVS